MQAAQAGEPSKDSVSRQRVIDAAIACILDQGFYRASTNAIAQRAGVSWGVIQYHFGNRETLMLAVLEEGTRRLNDILQTADITGDVITERVAQYMDILARTTARSTISRSLRCSPTSRMIREPRSRRARR